MGISIIKLSILITTTLSLATACESTQEVVDSSATAIVQADDQCPQGPLPTDLHAALEKDRQQDAGDVPTIRTGYFSGGASFALSGIGIEQIRSAFDFDRRIYFETTVYKPKQQRAIPVNPGEFVRTEADGYTAVFSQTNIPLAQVREFACLINLSEQRRQKPHVDPAIPAEINELLESNFDSAAWEGLRLEGRTVYLDPSVSSRMDKLLGQMKLTLQSQRVSH